MESICRSCCFVNESCSGFPLDLHAARDLPGPKIQPKYLYSQKRVYVSWLMAYGCLFKSSYRRLTCTGCRSRSVKFWRNVQWKVQRFHTLRNETISSRSATDIDGRVLYIMQIISDVIKLLSHVIAFHLNWSIWTIVQICVRHHLGKSVGKCVHN